MEILRHDPRNKTCLASGQSEELMPAIWFVAAKVRLNNDSFADLVVMAANPCLNGANIVPFWVFRGTAGEPVLVLRAHGLTLELRTTKSKGHRDVRLTSVTSKRVHTAIYKFNGRKYEARSRRPRSNRSAT